MSRDAAGRYEAWRNGHNWWASSLDQLGGDELDQLVAELAAEADQLDPARAAFHSYDLVLNAGDQGGAERVGLPLLRVLARRSGGYSHLARPASPRTSTQTLYRGGDSWRRCSWTPDRRTAQTYAESEPEGGRRLVAAPLWRFEAPPEVLLAIIPEGLAGGVSEWVVDADRITEPTRLDDDDVSSSPRDPALWLAPADTEPSLWTTLGQSPGYLGGGPQGGPGIGARLLGWR